MIFWIWLTAIVVALVLYFRQLNSRFSRRGVKTLKPIPLLGNTARVMLRKEHVADDIVRTYNAFPGERFVGKYEFTTPIVLIRDLELIKRITVKDFEHFLDHRQLIKTDSDQLFGRLLVSMKGQEWKDMRSALSPAFTSSKIRLMVPLMVEVGDQMIKALRKDIEESEDDYIDVDVRDLTTRYANDVIASCAFGLKVDSQTEKQNMFYMKGKEALDVSFMKILKSIGFIMLPKLMSILKVNVFSEDTEHFFKSLVMNSIRDREERHIVRPDMIHLLMQARQGHLTHDDKTAEGADAGFATVEESSVGKKQIKRVWSDNDLIAQALLFFFAGFDTVSSGMMFLLHELAVNPDVQEKLVQEIRENDAKNGSKFDYNSIQQMTYLDMVISELLRLWPPSLALDRLCIKDYNLGRPNHEATEDFIIRKGQGIAIPTWAIHRDPEYFPDPLRFDPERFSEQNKHNIKPYTYMPFGLGPRNCIGSRFALCEMKVMTYQLLQSMEVSPGAKTQLPAELSKEDFNVRLKGGHWARLKIRN